MKIELDVRTQPLCNKDSKLLLRPYSNKGEILIAVNGNTVCIVNAEELLCSVIALEKLS